MYLTFEEYTDETFVASVQGLRTIDRGQSVVTRIPEHSIHLFDRESGEAVRNRQLNDFESPEPPLS